MNKIIEKAIRKAVRDTIKKIGLVALKKASMFASNQKKKG